jgi:thermitase
MDKTGSANPGHGTHCAGIVGATGLVDGGVIGLSPEVSMMPLRFLGEDGSGDLNAGIKAIDYAIEKKVDIISASWGATIGRAQAQPLVDAVKRADDAGLIFIVAAANDGRNNDSTEVYPANSGFPNTISVAASGPNDEKPSWSNYGKRTVHVAAPGLNIMSSLPGNKYQNLSGTSMATPLVSGLVAFLKAQDKSLTGAQVRALLQLTGAKVQIETACNCRVDALSSVEMLLGNKMWITPAAGTLGVGETLKFEGTKGKAPFTFAVSNSSVGSIAADGTFTASAKGTTQVTVTDADGQTSTSLDIVVADKSATPPPGGGGACPIGDQQMCDILCQIQPTLPFCNQ